MSLSADEIGMVVDSLNQGLDQGIVRKVISPKNPDRIAIELRTQGKNHFLQIVTLMGAARLGRLQEKPPSLETPHPFVMLLRKELHGMVFQEASQLNEDRAVKLTFAAKERQGALICELTGRHANIFLTDALGLIIGSFYPNRSHKRQLVPNEPYQPIFDHPHAKTGPARFSKGPDLEEQIQTHYGTWEKNQEVTRLKAGVRRFATTQKRRLDRLAKKLEQDKARSEKAASLANLGHLLKANLYRAKKGQDCLEVTDFEGREAVIPLDPRLSPTANMERLFSKAKRLKRATTKIDERQAVTHAKREWIIDRLAQIEDADLDRLEELDEEIKRRFSKLVQKKQAQKKGPSKRLPFREYAISTGRPARVGRSAAENDTLTLSHAKPDDLWLHVRGQRGSHVVVPMGRGEDPTPDLLIDAAHLAAHFSDAKNQSDVEISYTKRRYVQKPRGFPKGAVRLMQEKTIALRIEPDRLKRILDRP